MTKLNVNNSKYPTRGTFYVIMNQSGNVKRSIVNWNLVLLFLRKYQQPLYRDTVH